MSKNHKMIGACLSVLMLLGALSVVIARIRAAAGSAEEVRRVASSDSRAIVVKTASQGLSRSNSLEMERVTITPRGFEPNVITHAPGRFLLAVDNRSGHDDLTLHLDGETTPLTTGLPQQGKLARSS